MKTDPKQRILQVDSKETSWNMENAKVSLNLIKHYLHGRFNGTFTAA